MLGIYSELLFLLSLLSVVMDIALAWVWGPIRDLLLWVLFAGEFARDFSPFSGFDFGAECSSVSTTETWRPGHQTPECCNYKPHKTQNGCYMATWGQLSSHDNFSTWHLYYDSMTSDSTTGMLQCALQFNILIEMESEKQKNQIDWLTSYKWQTNKTLKWNNINNHYQHKSQQTNNTIPQTINWILRLRLDLTWIKIIKSLKSFKI